MERTEGPGRIPPAWGLVVVAAGAVLLAAVLDLFGDEPRPLGLVPQLHRAGPRLCLDSAPASEWILVVGASLGLWGWWMRPDWRLRAGALVALTLAVVAIQAAAWPRIDRCNGAYGLRAQPDDSLAGRYARHHHWLVIRGQAYLAAHPFVAGRELRWVEGSSLDPRKLLALAQPARLVRWEPPSLATERAEAFLRPRASLRLGQEPRDRAPFELLLVAPRARRARYFVAIRIGDTDYLIGEPTWERLVDVAGR